MYTFCDVSRMRGSADRPALLHARCGVNLFAAAPILYLPKRGEGLHPDYRPINADYYIARGGDVYMMTPPGRWVHHLEATLYKGLPLASEQSSQQYIGVALEDSGLEAVGPTAEQYVATASLLRALIEAHKIPLWNVTTDDMILRRKGVARSIPSFSWERLSHEVVAPSFEGGYLVFPAVLA